MARVRAERQSDCATPSKRARGRSATSRRGLSRKVRRAAEGGDHARRARTCTCASGIYEGSRAPRRSSCSSGRWNFLFDFSCSELEWVAEDDAAGRALFKGKADAAGLRVRVWCRRPRINHARLRRRLEQHEAVRVPQKDRVRPWRRWLRQNSRPTFARRRATAAARASHFRRATTRARSRRPRGRGRRAARRAAAGTSAKVGQRRGRATCNGGTRTGGGVLTSAAGARVVEARRRHLPRPRRAADAPRDRPRRRRGATAAAANSLGPLPEVSRRLASGRRVRRRRRRHRRDRRGVARASRRRSSDSPNAIWSSASASAPPPAARRRRRWRGTTAARRRLGCRRAARPGTHQGAARRSQRSGGRGPGRGSASGAAAATAAMTESPPAGRSRAAYASAMISGRPSSCCASGRAFGCPIRGPGAPARNKGARRPRRAL